jgi:trans-2,3-dihydro-3-hydroxyanthranilate isomerase
MITIPFYIVDVFAGNKYEGNQLAVFLDLQNQIPEADLQKIAREINFAESAFVKSNEGDRRFGVRIFTPEHEVPFAGHPSLGSAYTIAKFLLPEAPQTLTLALAHGDIPISILQPDRVDDSIFFMRQAQPDMREMFAHTEVAQELGIDPNDLDTDWPIQEISTGLPYIIIPLKNLQAIEKLKLEYVFFQKFLEKRRKYKTNSATGHSTSLFFFTRQTCEAGNDFNTRMLLLENDRLSEDAATGSANGCLLAYLLKHEKPAVRATVEQGFQINRKSYVYLAGSLGDGGYEINVGGRVKLIAAGVWHV